MPYAVPEDAGTMSRQRRRKTFLEMVSLVTPLAAAVFFSGRLVAGWEYLAALAWAALTALLGAAYWTWHRGRYPAIVSPRTPDDQQTDPRPQPSEDGGWSWHPADLLLLVVAGVALAASVVVAVAVAFLLPLLVVAGFALSTGGAALGDVAGAALLTLVVAAIVEFALVHPLSRRWDLALDDDGYRRSDFCPPRS